MVSIAGFLTEKMNLQQVSPPKSYANGFGCQRGGDRDLETWLENKLQSGKSNPGRIPNAGIILIMACSIKDGTL
ncbi:hypothetical protein SLA2020_429220 [Shorea laevis]